ncbi:AraC family transcriptional regulator [Pseudomonas luteola]|uniref:AraC family transcriptional regulator n=1 Tax=Pseudomonas luteola TaxID=47886 RepID=UPI001239C051|nr:AraC family transcriptional regulator [Pseudomonas luteola]QEU26320.1 AraC family transcriptional regulator [Pseudomonas luteola]
MECRLLNDQSRVFERADPYRVSDYVNEYVGPHRIRLPTVGRPEANLYHRRFAELDLCRISYGDSVRVTSTALDSIYHLQLFINGHCLWRCRGEEHYFVPGEMLLINPDDPVDLTYSSDCDKFIVKLPVSLLEATCREHRWLLPKEGIRFTSARNDLKALDGFVSLMALICQEAEAMTSLPQVQEHYARIVASKLLSLLKHNVDPLAACAQATSFDQISAYIDAHLAHDISVEQLATLARVSVRSLYALFERHVNSSPKEYIRQRKLDHIHARLSDPYARVRSVTEIALDYGFLHLGRFSQLYRQRFGELPSETFKRHR